MAIFFYSKTEQFVWLSNFSRHGFECDGKYWLTVEHYFQAAKFVPTDFAYSETIRIAENPKKAKALGRSRKHPLRIDWELVKDDIMRSGVLRKFETHREIQLALLETNDEELIENAPSDYYWGCGRTGTGKNMLGIILMEVREKLRQPQI